jgi:hypothetical protein
MRNFILAAGVTLLLAVAVGGQAGPREGVQNPKNSKKSDKQEDSKMGQMVFVAYRPKPQKDAALLELVRSHHSRLKAQGLVTDRPAYAMRAKDGTIIEVFEWKSSKAVDEAHTNPVVQAMWKEFGEACDYVPLAQLEETKQLFAGFTSIDLVK